MYYAFTQYWNNTLVSFSSVSLISHLLRKLIGTDWLCLYSSLCNQKKSLFGVLPFCVFTSISETLDKPEHSTCWARSSTCQKKEKLQMRSRLKHHVEGAKDYVDCWGFLCCPHLQPAQKVCETHLCQLLHNSTSVELGLVVLLVVLAKSSIW